MRSRKLLKIFGISAGLLLVVLLLSVAIFVFNPFEGSLPDLRFSVPRDVDYFLRKVDLQDDFSDFPEPLFWEELSIHPEWAQIKSAPTYRDLNGAGQITRALQDIRDQTEQLRSQSGGQLDLMRDFLGTEVQVAGRLTGGATPATWCVYSRISWRGKFAWGVLGYTFAMEEMRKSGIQVRSDGDLLVLKPQGSNAELFAARHLDCLLLGSDRDLVQRSWELAAGIGDQDSFGGSANYQDGIDQRIEDWEDTTGEVANALEFFVRPSRLFRLPDVTFDDNWPDPNHPTDMNARVLASFLNLDSWLGLTGAMIFEPGTVSLLANIELNQNEHTTFQSNFFKTESQSRKDWLDPFLRMVPARDATQEGACAAAAMRMPAGDFLREMYSAMDDADKSLLNDSLRKTGQYDGVLDLIEKLEIAFHPRTGFVFRRNTPDPEIPVATPAPTPQFAWVFWLRPGGEDIVANFVELLTRYRGVIGLEQAYNLPLGLAGQGVGGDAAREFTNPHIPGTGSFATLVFPPFFVLSNSGPFIKDMMNTLVGNRPSIFSKDDFLEYSTELPNSVNGFIYIECDELERVLKEYERDIDLRLTDIDADWAQRNRARAQTEAFRKEFSTYASMAAIPDSGPERERFDAAIQAELETMWRVAGSSYTADAKANILETVALTRLFDSAYMQITLEPRYLHFTARAIANFR